MIAPLLEIRFNMKATVLNQWSTDQPDEEPEQAPVAGGGHYEYVQDEETGGVKRVWIDDVVVATPAPGRKATFVSPRGQGQFDMPCSVRGFPEVGFRSSANTESFEDGLYKQFEAINMTFPARFNLSRRQLVTNIRSRNDVVLWLEEETGKPTVFEVQGVTPTFDPFGRHIDNLTVLRRADVQ